MGNRFLPSGALGESAKPKASVLIDAVMAEWFREIKREMLCPKCGVTFTSCTLLHLLRLLLASEMKDRFQIVIGLRVMAWPTS
jgi:hypothetical protein